MIHRNFGKPWSQQDRDDLARLFPHNDIRTLVKIFGRPKKAITAKANKMGLTKADDYQQPRYGTFEKGHQPWNKGTSYSAPGSELTQFKKGNKPHTWLPIGSERVTKDGYLERKLTDTGVTRHDWKPVSHIEWEKHNGRPVPKGHAVIFRDGDKRNFAPANLELISRADLMRRNTYLNMPEPLPQLIQLRGALTAKINRRSKQLEEQN